MADRLQARVAVAIALQLEIRLQCYDTVEGRLQRQLEVSELSAEVGQDGLLFHELEDDQVAPAQLDLLLRALRRRRSRRRELEAIDRPGLRVESLQLVADLFDPSIDRPGDPLETIRSDSVAVGRRLVAIPGVGIDAEARSVVLQEVREGPGRKLATSEEGVRGARDLFRGPVVPAEELVELLDFQVIRRPLPRVVDPEVCRDSRDMGEEVVPGRGRKKAP